MDLTFKRSSACADASCLEVAHDPVNQVWHLRQSDGGAVVTVTEAEWDAFTAGVRTGDFSTPTSP